MRKLTSKTRHDPEMEPPKRKRKQPTSCERNWDRARTQEKVQKSFSNLKGFRFQ